MRTTSIFPNRIASMIKSGYNRGWNSEMIADHINSSRTAKNLKVKVTTRSIAAKIANYSRDRG
jgi:hypothetical protein